MLQQKLLTFQVCCDRLSAFSGLLHYRKSNVYAALANNKRAAGLPSAAAAALTAVRTDRKSKSFRSDCAAPQP